MTVSFPLYDTFFKATSDVSERPLDKEEVEYFLNEMPKLDANGAELMYMLIKIYALEHQQTEFLPYGGKILKRGTRFELDECPPHLQQILYAFLKKTLLT